jgi:hypothetical protein
MKNLGLHVFVCDRRTGCGGPTDLVHHLVE